MIRAKVVLLGTSAVGKTSLVRRYVHSVFSDTHLSTLGVKVDRKVVNADSGSVTMLLWDMHGETDGLTVPTNYLRGAAAGLLVFDSTRPETLQTAHDLGERLAQSSPNATVQYVANKADLNPDWSAVDAAADALGAPAPLRVSAKDGTGVEEMFRTIAAQLISP